jgi:hypothetical protein
VSIVFVLDDLSMPIDLVHEVMQHFPVLRIKNLGHLQTCKHKFPVSYLHSMLLATCETIAECELKAQPDIPVVALCHDSGCSRWSDVKEKRRGWYHFVELGDEEVAVTLAKLIQSVCRQGARSAHQLSFSDLILDPLQGQLRLRHDDVCETLTAIESRILAFLIENSGRCVSRHALLGAVWNNTRVTDRTLDSHISRLRKRIEGASVTIEAVYGEGYVLKETNV